MVLKFKYFISTFCLLFGLLVTHIGFTCTRVLVANTSQAVMVGRNMDWLEDMQANLWVYPEGLVRDGMAQDNSLKWTAKYGSLVATVYDQIMPITTDGMNERGLAAHLLSLPESDYGQRDDKLPGMSVLLWAQYYLDNFQTVDEAVQFTQANSLQLIPFYDAKLQKYIPLTLQTANSGECRV